MKEKKAFTLIELIIAVTISSIVLLFVFSYVSDTMRAIAYSIRYSEFIVEYEDFITKIDSYKKLYTKNSILVDHAKGVGNDILLLLDENDEYGVVLGVVDTQTNTLEKTVSYGVYGHKVIGLRELSSQEVTELIAAPNNIYNYSFHEDKLLEKIIVKEFQAVLYNSGSIFDVNMYVNMNYRDSLKGVDYAEIGDEYIEKFSINF